MPNHESEGGVAWLVVGVGAGVCMCVCLCAHPFYHVWYVREKHQKKEFSEEFTHSNKLQY